MRVEEPRGELRERDENQPTMMTDDGDELRQAVVRPRVATLRRIVLTLTGDPKPDDLPIHPRIEPNEDLDEQEIALRDPIISDPGEFDQEELSKAMTKEIDSLRNFQVFQEVSIQDCSEDEIRNAYYCKWVHRLK